jgi:hypothetical protein
MIVGRLAPAAYLGCMDRYRNFGLRGDADEQFCRAVRDGFKRVGLSPAQLTQAWSGTATAASILAGTRRSSRRASPSSPH